MFSLDINLLWVSKCTYPQNNQKTIMIIIRLFILGGEGKILEIP